MLIVCVAWKKASPNQVNSHVTIFYQQSASSHNILPFRQHVWGHSQRVRYTLSLSGQIRVTVFEKYFLFNVSPFSEIPFISICSSANIAKFVLQISNLDATHMEIVRKDVTQYFLKRKLRSSCRSWCRTIHLLTNFSEWPGVQNIEDGWRQW